MYSVAHMPNNNQHIFYRYFPPDIYKLLMAIETTETSDVTVSDLYLGEPEAKIH